VINPLGNYERVVALRDKLKTPSTGSPDDIAAQLLLPAAFVSADNSTHLSLPQAMVARSFLTASKMPYYLIVISDFYEDCLNRPVEDYAKKEKEIAAENARVLRGEFPYNDGGSQANKNKYTAEDVADIKFLHEKINGLLLGEFIYQGKARTPVNVKVFSPVVKRSIAIQAKTSQWILPDPPPSLVVAAEGLDDDALMEVKLMHQESGKQHVLKESCGLVTAKNQLSIAKLLATPEIKDLIAAGQLDVILSIPQTIGPSLEAKTRLAICVPNIRIDDPKLNDSKENQPYEFAANKEIKTEEFTIRLEPAPDKAHDIVITCGEKSVTVDINKGAGTFTLGKFLDDAETNKPISLTATLKLDPTAAVAKKSFWINIPEVSIWADGHADGNAVITFDKSNSLDLKASHAGMEGFDWRETTVTRKGDGPKVNMEMDANNHLDFSEVEPGTYLVTAKFGTHKKPIEKTFTVIVPKKTPWMLIALIVMACLSIGLFAWHFLRRR
jgi:hypothetical protein